MVNMAFAANMNMDYKQQIDLIMGFSKHWSECERAIVIFKMLESLPGFWVKFVLSTIEQQLAKRNDNEHLQKMEQESNDKLYVTKLYEKYKKTSACESDSYFSSEQTNNNKNNNISHNSNNNIYHHLNNIGHMKENILEEILRCTLLIKNGNEDVKKVYLSLIPYMVEDARRGLVSTKNVQQYLSYILIHPALNDNDKKSLREHKQMLQDHIRNSNQTEQFNSNNWQAVAPPTFNSTPSLSSTCSSLPMFEMNIRSSDIQWDTQSIPFCHDHTDIDGNNASHELFPPLGQPVDLNSTKSTDDHHVSFSKNGTEITDFNPDLENSSSHFTDDYIPILADHIAVKTRRSNSLNTGMLHQNTYLTAVTSSMENLTTAMHKSRSFSETRLSEFNPSAKAFQPLQAGMSNMNSWLKNLRLHKYDYIFTNWTYDQMTDITEEYLTSIAITKGARDKLFGCIQKLKERFNMLKKFEHDLKNGSASLADVLTEMLEILKTPIKPIDASNKEDVAQQFINLLDLVFKMSTMPNQPYMYYQQVVLMLMQVVVSASHNEAFVSYRDLLRSYKYHLTEINKQFPKTYTKNGPGNAIAGNPIKPRSKSTTKPHIKCGNDNKPNRRNSNSNFVTTQPLSVCSSNGKPCKPSYGNASYHYPAKAGYNKSSSYPNFNSSGGIQHSSHHNSYHHRHSISNLITITPSQTTASIVTTPSASHLHLEPKSATINNFFTPKMETTISTSPLLPQNATMSMKIACPVTSIAAKLSQNNNNNFTSNANLSSAIDRSHSFGGATNVVGDMNSDREYFIRQIAEQAIN